MDDSDGPAVHFDAGDDYTLCEWRFFGETATSDWAKVTCEDCKASSNPPWWERAQAGQCSHHGHGWDGEVCSDGLYPDHGYA